MKELCFYCGEKLYEPSHVDHVIPFKALEHNQFWNLVVAHQTCNLRKTDYLVGLHFIENLIKRNEFVIKSHLPLHKEIKADLGINPALRRKKILDSYLYAKNEKNCQQVILRCKEENIGFYEKQGLKVNGASMQLKFYI